MLVAKNGRMQPAPENGSAREVGVEMVGAALLRHHRPVVLSTLVSMEVSVKAVVSSVCATGALRKHAHAIVGVPAVGVLLGQKMPPVSHVAGTRLAASIVAVCAALTLLPVDHLLAMEAVLIAMAA